MYQINDAVHLVRLNLKKGILIKSQIKFSLKADNDIFHIPPPLIWTFKNSIKDSYDLVNIVCCNKQYYQMAVLE